MKIKKDPPRTLSPVILVFNYLHLLIIYSIKSQKSPYLYFKLIEVKTRSRCKLNAKSKVGNKVHNKVLTHGEEWAIRVSSRPCSLYIYRRYNHNCYRHQTRNKESHNSTITLERCYTNLLIGFCGGSFCFMSWCLKYFCAVGALCMFAYFS